VHRLDASTSGLIVVAKTDAAFYALGRAFAERAVRKVYHALVWGRPDPPQGLIDRSIGRSRTDPTRMSVHGIRGGRSARTTYRTIETFSGFAFLEVRIETGRTHQIRVHLQSIHHPVVGDPRYGGEQSRGVQDPRRRNALRSFGRVALHASELSFVHPATGEETTFRSALPPELARLLEILRQ
jgi:23S rRNA pseudouridine1911/1915/1917 synthase